MSPEHPTVPAPFHGGQPGRFCGFCGRRLVERMVPDGFDTRTGKPRFELRRDCPVLLDEDTSWSSEYMG